MPDRGPVGFGRRSDAEGAPAGVPVVEGAVLLGDAAAADLLPKRPERGHKGSFGKLLVHALWRSLGPRPFRVGLSLDY